MGFGEAASPLWRSKKLAARFWRLVRGKNNNLSGGRNHKRAAKRAKNFGTAQASYKCSCSGVPLKVKKKISRHKTLSALQKSLEVLDEDLESAIATLKF